jgi:spore germination protein
MSRQCQNQVLTPFQLYSIVFGGMLGFGALTVSRYAVSAAGRDGWISVFLAGVIVVLNSYIILRLGKRFPRKTIVQYSQEITGKLLGKVISILMAVSAVIISGLLLSITAYVTKEWILTYTPSSVIYITFLFSCLYVCLKDLKVLGRVSVLIFFFHIVFFLLFIPPVAQSGKIMNILPAGRSGILDILRGIPSVLYGFAGYELISVFYAYSENTKKSTRACIWSMITTSLVLALAAITQIIVFPLEYIKKLWVPSINFIAQIYVPFIERVDIIFITSWMYVFFKVISNYFYAATLEIQQIFNIKNRKIICYIVAPAIFLTAYLSNEINEIDKFTFWAMTSTVVLHALITVLLYILSIILKKGKIK